MLGMDFNDFKRQTREDASPTKSQFSTDTHDLGGGGVNFGLSPHENSAKKAEREQKQKEKSEKRFQLLRDLQREIKFGDRTWAKNKLQQIGYKDDLERLAEIEDEERRMEIFIE